jgi:hypothetical protein
MKKMAVIICGIAELALFSGCISSNQNSEVMIDTTAKTKKNTPEGASEPGDFEKMSDPFLSGN